jgi:hypothetical protein
LHPMLWNASKAALVATLALLSLVSCVSTMMEGYLGKPIEEAQLEFGPPIQVLDMPDGRRAFQFRYGGGPVMVPGSSTSTVTTYGNTATVNTFGTPGGVLYTEGCILTFFALKEGNAWIIRDLKVPGGLVC